jgi:hypothetical protein
LDQLRAPRLTSSPARRTPPPPSSPAQISPGTILLLAAACGLIVANIYYAQPLIGPIAQSLGLASRAAGLIATMAQIGYGAGLLAPRAAHLPPDATRWRVFFSAPAQDESEWSYSRFDPEARVTPPSC